MSEKQNPKSQVPSAGDAKSQRKAPQRRRRKSRFGPFAFLRFRIVSVFRFYGLRRSPLSVAASAQAATGRLDLYPPDIRLRSSFARQQIVVVATRPDGVTEDVRPRPRLPWPTAHRPPRKGTVYPIANGQTTLQAQYDGQRPPPAGGPGVAVARPISFSLDVMPVFMRAGCNTGTCHGSARGKDGFSLSLFGFDPEGDYFRLTHEIGFRRVNLALPEEPHAAEDRGHRAAHRRQAVALERTMPALLAGSRRGRRKIRPGFPTWKRSSCSPESCWKGPAPPPQSSPVPAIATAAKET